MIAVDASALVAILRHEPDSERLGAALADRIGVMTAPSLLEAKMVLSGRLEASAIDRLIDGLTTAGGLRIVDFTPAMAEAAVAAFRAYGKGRGHPAQLNFGDCMAYGAAKVLDVPLLYKGEDFALTDIRPALP